MKSFTIVGLVFVLSASAWADEIKLKNGGRVVGIVREQGERVVIDVKIGTVIIPQADIESIEFGRTSLHDYRDRLDRIGESGSAQDWFDLGTWAEGQGLSRYAPGLFQRVIAIDPDHEAAREKLGFIRHEGQWMTTAERNQALGYVLFRGRWMLPADRSALLDAEARALTRPREVTRSNSSRPVEPTPITLGLPKGVYTTHRPSTIYSTDDYYGNPLPFFPGFGLPALPLPVPGEMKVVVPTQPRIQTVPVE